MIKLIATDMDGTLLNGNHRISKENLQALQSARQSNIRLVIATGRIIGDVADFIEGYGLDPYYLTMNGAELHDPQRQLLHASYIDPERAKSIYAIMRKYPSIYIEIYTDHGHYSADSRLHTYRGLLQRMREVRPGANLLSNILWSLRNPHYRHLNYLQDLNMLWNKNIRIAKFITFSQDTRLLQNLQNELEQEVPHIAISSSFRTNIEINDAAATKGQALMYLTKRLNIREDEVLVLGDGSNDLSMFQAFPTHATAMGNAIPEMKQAAAKITDDNLHHGVANAIYAMLKKQ